VSATRYFTDVTKALEDPNMLSAKLSRIKRIGKRALRIALSTMLVLQML
jgi:hypothetical protein